MKFISIPILTALALAAPAFAQAKDAAQPVQANDPIQPIHPAGFERQDTEDMDRRFEERVDQWRTAEAAKAKVRKAEKAAARAAAGR